MNSYQPTSEDILKSMDNCTKCGICNSYCPVSNVTNQFHIQVHKPKDSVHWKT